jgi:hypothetical protein
MLAKQVGLFCFFLFCSSGYAQIDSSGNKGTIKIAKYSDTLFIKVVADWSICHKSTNADLTFTSFSKIARKTEKMGPQNNLYKVVKGPSPDHSIENFDFEAYFRTNHFTKEIKLRKGEEDVVNYYVTVNKLGQVRFCDALPVEKLGDTMVVYTDYSKTKYKIDIVHRKTYKAFAELAESRWRPAKISELKRHPSKRRVKYRKSTGYTYGTISIMYSSMPFKN